MNITPNESDLSRSEKYYSEESFFKKIGDFATEIPKKVVYHSLLLYAALKSSKTPFIYRSLIVGALGYFICPIDIVPDFIPGAGYADDLAALAYILASLKSKKVISQGCRNFAKEQLHEWFGAAADESLMDLPDESK